MVTTLTIIKEEIQGLTSREEEVLKLITYEYSSKEIAAKLYLSYETVHTYRKNLLRKLNVKNTAGMVRVAFEKGLLVIAHNKSDNTTISNGLMTVMHRHTNTVA